METIVSLICHIKKGDAFLFRKKPDGSPPYKETYYSFGAPLNAGGNDPFLLLVQSVKQRTGTDIEVTESLWWDHEVKIDIDGIEKHFIYLHTIAEYRSGTLVHDKSIERLVWIKADELDTFDIVPPSRKFLNKYLNMLKSNT